MIKLQEKPIPNRDTILLRDYVDTLQTVAIDEELTNSDIACNGYFIDQIDEETSILSFLFPNDKDQVINNRAKVNAIFSKYQVDQTKNK